MPHANEDFIRHAMKRSLEAAATWRWCREPLTLGGARAFVLQHILRNRFYSAVMRPAWMSRCPDLAVVRKTISQMREELVRDDKIEAAHTEILWQFGRNIGLTDDQMGRVTPEPLVALSFSALENLARTHHWIAGWLGSSVGEYITIHLEGHNFNPESWKRTLGLSEEQVFFLRYHNKADLDHAGEKVWEPLRRHVTSAEVRDQVDAGLTIALEAHRCFHEGVGRLGDRLDQAMA